MRACSSRLAFLSSKEELFMGLVKGGAIDEEEADDDGVNDDDDDNSVAGV